MDVYAIDLLKELGLTAEQVERTMALAAEIAKAPFVARHGTEVTEICFYVAFAGCMALCSSSRSSSGM